MQNNYWFILRISLFLIGQLLSNAVDSQTDFLIDYATLTPDDGLATSYTSTIFQDSKGFVWIGTRHGLNRYDGYHFELYSKEKNGLYRNNAIDQILEDDRGNIWLFYKGHQEISGRKFKIIAIDIFNPITKQAIPIQTYFDQPLSFKVEDLLLTRLLLNKKQEIWLTNTKGALFRGSSRGIEKVFQFSNPLTSTIITDNKDNLWAANDNILVQINSKSKQLIRQDSFPNPIDYLWLGANNHIWAATRYEKQQYLHAQIYRQKDALYFEPFFLFDEEQKVNLKNLLFCDFHRMDNGWWLVNINEELHVFDEQGKGVALPPQLKDFNLKNYFFSTIKINDELWTPSGLGIFKYITKPNYFYPIKTNEVHDCRGITEDSAGNIYLLDDWIYKYDTSKQVTTQLASSHGTFHLFQKDSCFYSSIYNSDILLIETNTITNKTSYYQDSTLRFAYASLPIDTNKILIGTSKGLVYVNTKTKKVHPFTQYNTFGYLANAAINQIHPTASGIWLATSEGMYWMTLQDGIKKGYNSASGDLPFSNIRYFQLESDSSFWLATNGGGLIHWRPDFKQQTSTFEQFTVKDGLSHDYLYAVFADDYDNLWIASDRGLMCFNKTNNSIRTYLEQDGIPNKEFNHTAHYQASDGTLYFGTLGGFFSFHPKDISIPLENDVPVQLTNIYILENDKSEVTDKTTTFLNESTISIQPKDKFLELHFSPMDFYEEKDHQYLYKIEGFSDVWNRTNGNVIRITNLPYGTYTLKIKGRNLKRGWSTQALTKVIHVQLPLYLQPRFLMIMGLLSIITGYTFIKWRERQLKIRNLELENLVQSRTNKIEADKKIIEKQTEALAEMTRAKSRFFSNITHELRTPLTLIIGPLQQVLQNATPSATSKKLQGVLNNAEHILKLINQLLTLSKLENKRMAIELSRGDIVATTQKVVDNLQSIALKKQQQLVFDASKEKWLTNYDAEKWNKIVYNLLFNAIKFTPSNGRILLKLTKQQENNKEQIKLLVADNGIGIDNKELSLIFNRFYQVNDSITRSYEGTGIGLSLVKELVELQKGTIKVASEKGKGTSFEVSIPVLQHKIISKSDEEVTLDLEAKSHAEFTHTTPKTNKQKLTLLIIEDNKALQSYIADCLNGYNIFFASNGSEGIERALEIIPDLIITDIMMPLKDGFEVTKALRNNLITSHIPIIILTAKTSLKSRLNGIQTGVDVYLTKPFNAIELNLRVEKLIEIRYSLQQKYQKLGQITSNQLPKNYLEKERIFMDKVNLFIKQHLKNSDLNGRIISQHFRMSRMQLHRKLKAITNLNTSELIQSVRLEVASELLKTQRLNVSEVAFQTGFTSSSYFSKVFKKKFGISPSEITH
ncbi:MAG: ATP-binding protein [Bacteroidota bacterium]